jgi:hypothetical protein
MPSPYKRGRSGYSEADEVAAERNAMLERRISSDALRRKNAGERGIVMSSDEVDARTRNTRANYLDRLSTEAGREQNVKNESFAREVDLPAANSRAQYESEKEAGDPNALRMSFAEWKKL